MIAVRQEAPEQFIQAVGHESLRAFSMREIQSIAVEFWYAARSDDDAGRVREFEDIESEEEGLAEGCSETIVWVRGKGEEVDLRGR